MNKSEQKRFDELYLKHLRSLKLQGMSDKTIEAYARGAADFGLVRLLPGSSGTRTVGWPIVAGSGVARTPKSCSDWCSPNPPVPTAAAPCISH